MFQEAPMPEELTTYDPDAWAFPVLPGQDEGSLASSCGMKSCFILRGNRGSAGSTGAEEFALWSVWMGSSEMDPPPWKSVLNYLDQEQSTLQETLPKIQ